MDSLSADISFFFIKVGSFRNDVAQQSRPIVEEEKNIGFLIKLFINVVTLFQIYNTYPF